MVHIRYADVGDSSAESEDSYYRECKHHGPLEPIPDVHNARDFQIARRFRRLTSKQRHEKIPPKEIRLRLYGRTIRLGAVSEDIPLYSLCRAWSTTNTQTKSPVVKNKRKLSRKSLSNIYQLPPPSEAFVTRIPSLTEQQLATNTNAVNLNYDDNTLPSKDELLTSHRARWNSVKIKWKQAAAANESRYAESFAILQNIYKPMRDTSDQ